MVFLWLSSEEVDTEIGVSELPETVTQTSEDSVITLEGNNKEINDRQVREDEAASNIEPEVIEDVEGNRLDKPEVMPRRSKRERKPRILIDV